MSEVKTLEREFIRTLRELTQPKIKMPTQAKEPVQQSKAINESLQAKSLKGLLYKFDCIYAHWKVDLKLIEKGLINKAPPSNLQVYVNALESNLKELSVTYYAYSDIEAPTSHLRRRYHKCHEVTKDVVHTVQAQIHASEKELRLRLEQLEAENIARKLAMEKIRQDIEHMEKLKQALLPEVSLVAKDTCGSDSKMNTTEEVKEPVTKEAVKAAKKPAATKKPKKKVAAKKPRATKKQHKTAKKPATKRRAAKGPKKSTKSSKKDHRQELRSWRGRRKEKRNFKEHRKRELVRASNVGGKNSRPPDKLLL